MKKIYLVLLFMFLTSSCTIFPSNISEEGMKKLYSYKFNEEIFDLGVRAVVILGQDYKINPKQWSSGSICSYWQHQDSLETIKLCEKESITIMIPEGKYKNTELLIDYNGHAYLRINPEDYGINIYFEVKNNELIILQRPFYKIYIGRASILFANRVKIVLKVSAKVPKKYILLESLIKLNDQNKELFIESKDFKYRDIIIDSN